MANIIRRPIYSITKGGLVDGQGMKYLHGQKFRNGLTIVDIVYDEPFFDKTGSERYHLFVDAGSDSEAFLWKSVTGTDITPEYDIERLKIH